MNQESVSDKQGTQAKASSKRAHRATRNRHVLVTEQTKLNADEQNAQAIEEAAQPEVPVAVEEKPSKSEEAARRRGPRFFSNIGKAETQQTSPQADPQAARLARALR